MVSIRSLVLFPPWNNRLPRVRGSRLVLPTGDRVKRFVDELQLILRRGYTDVGGDQFSLC